MNAYCKTYYIQTSDERFAKELYTHHYMQIQNNGKEKSE